MSAARNDQSAAARRTLEAADWRSSAACLGAHPETFFPVGRDPQLSEPAKRICRRCPVVRTCLAEALTNDVGGVWGGTTYPERELIRERHDITAAPILSRFAIDNPLHIVSEMTGGGSSASAIAEQLNTTPRTIQRYRRINRGLSHEDR